MAKQKSYFIDPAKDDDELEKRKLLAGEVKSLATERDARMNDSDYGTLKAERSTASGIRLQAERLGVPQNALSNMFRQSLADLRKANPTTTPVAPIPGKDDEGRDISMLDSSGEPVSPIGGKTDQSAPYSGFTTRMGPSTPIGRRRVAPQPDGAPQPESPTGLTSRMGPGTLIKKDQRVSNETILTNLLNRAQEKRDKENELVKENAKNNKRMRELEEEKKVDREDDDDDEEDDEDE